MDVGNLIKKVYKDDEIHFVMRRWAKLSTALLNARTFSTQEALRERKPPPNVSCNLNANVACAASLPKLAKSNRFLL